MSAGAPGHRKEYLQQVKHKIASYCAYRERCSSEVREKLATYECQPDEIDELLKLLKVDGFLNDERYCQTFARDKLRQNKWGKIKIRQYLEQKQLDSDLIDQGLDSIPMDEYLALLDDLVQKKYPTVKADNPYVRGHKTAQSIVRKGYEPDLVWSAIKALQH